MTLEDLGLPDLETLEKMSDDDIRNFFKPKLQAYGLDQSVLNKSTVVHVDDRPKVKAKAGRGKLKMKLTQEDCNALLLKLKTLAEQRQLKLES